jgi:cation diffusion facilitator family transporter
VLIGARYWCEPPDPRHPHGHRRIETLVTIAISAVLAAVGVGLIVRAVETLEQGEQARAEWAVLVAALLSIAIKEVVYRWTAAVGRRLRSPAVTANAWHHRSDALSSVPVALAVIGVRINPAWWFLDPLAAVLVAALIFHAAWEIGWPALKELADTGAPEPVVDVIRKLALDVEGVRDVHALRTRYIGPGLDVDLHVLVEGGLTVREGHRISEEVKQRLLADGPRLVDVVVHIEPSDENETEAED